MTKRSLSLALLPLLLLSAGCTTTRFVTVPCVTQPQLDKLKSGEPPKVHDRLTGKADEDVKIVAGSAIRLRAWGNGLVNVLGGCVG